jgi:hypothetical protein
LPSPFIVFIIGDCRRVCHSTVNFTLSRCGSCCFSDALAADYQPGTVKSISMCNIAFKKWSCLHLQIANILQVTIFLINDSPVRFPVFAFVGADRMIFSSVRQFISFIEHFILHVLALRTS